MMGAVEKRVVKEVVFTLTDEETAAKGHEAYKIRMAQASIKEEFARVKSTFKGRIEEKDNQLSACLTAIGEGQEKRTVDCVERFDYHDAVVETLVDGRLIESRAMTNDERQLGLKFKKKGEDQGELPLAEPSPSPTTLAGPEPWLVQLPTPEQVDQETFVPGEADRPTKVRYLAEAWMQAEGEAATYRVVTEEVFGTPTLLWRRMQAKTDTKVAEADTKVSEPAEQVPQ